MTSAGNGGHVRGAQHPGFTPGSVFELSHGHLRLVRSARNFPENAAGRSLKHRLRQMESPPTHFDVDPLVALYLSKKELVTPLLLCTVRFYSSG